MIFISVSMPNLATSYSRETMHQYGLGLCVSHGFIIRRLVIMAYVLKKTCFLIFLRHLTGPKAVTNRYLSSPKRPYVLHACATCSKLPANISTMPPCVKRLHVHGLALTHYEWGEREYVGRGRLFPFKFFSLFLSYVSPCVSY